MTEKLKPGEETAEEYYERMAGDMNGEVKQKDEPYRIITFPAPGCVLTNDTDWVNEAVLVLDRIARTTTDEMTKTVAEEASENLRKHD